MALYDVEAEVGQQHQAQSLENVQLVGDLGVYLGVSMVRCVPSLDHGYDVKRVVEEEEERIVEEKARRELEGDSAARRRKVGKSALRLQRRRHRHVVQCWHQKRMVIRRSGVVCCDCCRGRVVIARL